MSVCCLFVVCLFVGLGGGGGGGGGLGLPGISVPNIENVPGFCTSVYFMVLKITTIFTSKKFPPSARFFFVLGSLKCLKMHQNSAAGEIFPKTS